MHTDPSVIGQESKKDPPNFLKKFVDLVYFEDSRESAPINKRTLSFFQP